MFKISSNLINTFNSNYSDISTLVKTGNYYRSTLATIGFNTSSQVLPNISSQVLPNTYGGAITLPANTQQVVTVIANGVILNPAVDPQNPQQGEYVFNPYTNQLTTYSNAATVQIDTTLATTGFNANSQVLSNTYGTPITLPANTQQILTVVANGVVLNPAVNPQNPQPGEFIFNPYTNQLTVYSNAATVQIYSTPQEIKFSPSLIRNLPDLFYLLPLEGDIQISRSFENHPQMSFSFETKFSKDTILNIFQPGREIDIQGVGYRVNNCNCVELPISAHPDGRCKVSVSFGGKWENKLNNPIFLRPQCLQGNVRNANNSLVVPLAKILERANISLIGKALKTVFVPWDTPADAVVQPDQLIQERLRVAQSFARYSKSQGIEIIDINSLDSHFIAESEIEGEISTDYQAISKSAKIKLAPISFNPQQPDLTNFPATITQPNIQITAEINTNLGFEYPLTELTGDLKDIPYPIPEKTQGQQPRYKRKPKTSRIRIDGNKDANIPPAGVNLIQVMSLCFDLGGEQETRTFVYEENETPVRTVEEIWGFAFTALEVYDASTGKLKGNPSEYWKLLRRVTTEFIYDQSLSGTGGTGYLLKKVGRGFNTVRWKTEKTDNPETLDFRGDSSEEATEQRKLYEFFRIPVVEKFSQSLRIMPERTNEGLFEVIPDCSAGGSRALINPDYAPPYYAEVQRTEKISFARRSNPDNEGRSIQAGDTFAPDLIVGSLEVYESQITGYTPPEYERKLAGFYGGYPVYRGGALLSPAKWYKYNKKFSAQGQAIATAIEDITVDQGEGNPPLAEPRRANLFTKEEPEESQKDKILFDDKKYRHFIWTDGHLRTDPISGTESFSEAKTLNEALTAARTKLAIENWRNGYTETLQLTTYRGEIKEGDLITYFCKGQYRRRVVISVNHTLNILGNIEGQPIVVGKTSLTLGKYLKPQLQSAKIEVPEISVVSIVKQTIGGLLDWEAVSSRRKP